MTQARDTSTPGIPELPEQVPPLNGSPKAGQASSWNILLRLH